MSIYGLFLKGWDGQSTWGWDDGLNTFYAQLTRNESSDSDGPDIWITPPSFPVIQHPEVLAQGIAHATGADVTKVRAAMNAGLDDEGRRRFALHE